VATVTSRPLDPERLPRLSWRARLLGGAGVLVAAAAMATLGFTGARPASPSVGPGPAAAVASPTPSGSADQLETLSLTEVRGHRPLGR
jgi:hypothetical protein